MTIALIAISWFVLVILVSGLCTAARRGDEVAAFESEPETPQLRRVSASREEVGHEFQDRGRVGRVAVG